MLEQIVGAFLAVPSEAWIGLAGVIVGAVISILGVWLANRSSMKQLRLQLLHERRSRAEDIKRDRLEELYILVGHWLNGLASNYINLSMVMQGKLKYDQYLKLVLEAGNKIKQDFTRLEMIIDIYAHELKPAYEEILMVRGELNGISTKYLHAYEEGDIDGERFLKPYTTAQLGIESKGETLKKKISEYAKSI